MRTTSITGVRAKAVAAALLLLTLGACGSESADSEGDDTGAPAALTDDPFCDQVDLAMVGTLLGMPEEKVKVVTERAVGDEFEGPNDEGAPEKSVSNLCVFGSGTDSFTVSVQPDASAADVDKTIKELSSLTGKSSSEQCERSDAVDIGDPSGAFTCTSNPPVKRVRVVMTGLVGGSMWYCAAAKNTGAGADFPDETFGGCRKTLEELSTAS